ncbi:MAG: SGNH/GDSL hydrolase family protein [Planctomycetaceae bacterium]|nr:SGNH/GDSL hydrolase family protein [Planctomycetaceae bacterium]
MKNRRSIDSSCWKCCTVLLTIFGLSVIVGCESKPRLADDINSAVTVASPSSNQERKSRFQSKSPTLDDADLRVLFVGNSHTQWHELPGLVADLIEFRRPNTQTATESIGVAFLDQVETMPHVHDRLNEVRWDHVVLQAQKISASGRFEHSTTEGIELAKLAIESGAKVHFFAEWGIQGDANNANHTDGIYRKMAEESQAKLIPVTLVWSRALVRSPGLSLYHKDGNHQSRLGASLTALAIATHILDESPELFSEYKDPVATESQWAVFCEAVLHTRKP